MANLHYFKDAEIDEEDKFLTVGELMSILKDINPKTKVFIRNLDEWGEKPVIENNDSHWELSDGLITDVKKANINQVTGEEEYIIIQGMINKTGFATLDYEPYEEVIYHHTWLEKVINRINPIETMKQLKDKYLNSVSSMNVKENCSFCKSYINGKCVKSKLVMDNDDYCELWEYNDCIILEE